MTHRAQTVVDTMAALLEAGLPSGVQVFTHRAESLAETPDAGELPAVSVDFGALELEDEGSNEATWALDVVVSIHVADASEKEVREELLRLAADAHQALTATTAAGLPVRVTLGLSWVAHVQARGFVAPEITAAAQVVLGSLSTQWRVVYSASLTDPEN